MKECFEKIGYKCDFLCSRPPSKPFGFHNITIKQITPDNKDIFNAAEYSLIVYAGSRLCKVYYKHLNQNNVKVVSFICGNHYVREHEDFIRKDAICAFNADRGDCDELWIIPSYRSMIDYMQIMRGVSGYIVPHLWSPIIINESYEAKYKTTWKEMIYNSFRRSGKSKIDIIIMEPNLGFIKTSWLPIVASEKLETDYGEILNKVYVYNYPEHKTAHDMISDFKVKNKLLKLNRIAIFDVFHTFQNSDTLPVFVSHHYKNSLNYLYYEILYYGYPLIHNSPDLDGCGYYYPENNIGKCVKAIVDAHTHHNKQAETYREKALKYLERVDPYHPDVGKIWKQMIGDVLPIGLEYKQ